MNLVHLISTTDWIEVWSSLQEHYHDANESLEKYRETFVNLRSRQPISNPMRICLRTTFRPGLDDQPSLEIVGRNGKLNRDLTDFKNLGMPEDSTYAISETEFALDFEPWGEWLGMEIEADTLSDHSAPAIVAHCLWEMTFHGFEESDVSAERAELQRRVDELDAMSEEERTKKLIPLDQVLKKLDAWKREDP